MVLVYLNIQTWVVKLDPSLVESQKMQNIPYSMVKSCLFLPASSTQYLAIYILLVSWLYFQGIFTRIKKREKKKRIA